MSKKLQKPISVLTSITTVVWLSGVAMLAPMSAVAADIVDGDVVSPDAEFVEDSTTYYPYDVFIIKIVGDKKFKRLILNPEVFESYGHLSWDNIKTISAETLKNDYTTSELVYPDNNGDGIADGPVYRLIPDGDTGTRQHLDMTPEEFVAEGYDWDSVYVINSTDFGNYTEGTPITPGEEEEEEEEEASVGTLTVTLAADTPAAGIAVEGAARLPFTKINLTASGGDVTVDSLVVERTGLGQDSAFSSLDIIDADTNLPINVNSKTLNSVHQATFNDDFTIADGTTKSIILAANMASTLDSYAGETPSLSLVDITLKGDATLNATLPITGNTMTINATISIGSARINRGAYSNATSTSIQVGKEDYTFFSFQIQAGSAEKIQFSQVKVYQEGSASLGSDVVNLELYQDSTKIADGEVVSSKYVNFSFDPITLDKGEIAQFQVKADVEDGSARTIDLGIYRLTDILVKGLTYGYNITPSLASGANGGSSNNPVLSDNQFTISNGTLTVTRSNEVPATNITIGNDQYLGAFKFTCKGEAIDISALTLTIVSSASATIEDALKNVELVDPNGNVVAGPTDVTNNALTVAWTDTFTVPVGETVYKVRGDLATNGGWASNDTIYVQFTPSAMTAQGTVTGNSITPSPSSAVSGNTQTVKAASLTVTRNTLPADQYIIVGQTDVVLTSWRFDASDSGEDIRITTLKFAGRGNAATNTGSLTVFIDNDGDGVWDEDTDEALSPINDAISSQPATSTFAFDDPIIITKGTSIDIALKGDKTTVSSNDEEQWGLTDTSVSVVAYGVTTGNSVDESLTADDGPTLTSRTKGKLTIETENNPSSAIVLAGSTGNVFTNVKLSAKYEDLRLDQLVVYVGDGSYSFNAGTGEYRDVTNVAIYDGTTKLAEASIPSTGKYTFNFDADTLTIPKGGSKTLTIKADMSTIDPDTPDAPGTNSADLKIGLGGDDGVKTTGKASNSEITGATYEVYRSSTSSVMVLRSSKPIVTLPSSSDSLGAATSLTNGNVCLYAFKVTADASGGDVLLYRTTFVFATSGSGMSLSSVYIKDQDGNTIKSADDPTDFGIDGSNLAYYTATFNNPEFSHGDDKEAIKIPAGESRTFKVYGTVSGAGTGENISAFLVGDTASTSSDVNDDNVADAFGIPNGDFATDVGNFIWSDNYKAKSVSSNDATNTAQWYNGHLVPGLENAVSTTPYVVGWSG